MGPEAYGVKLLKNACKNVLQAYTNSPLMWATLTTLIECQFPHAIRREEMREPRLEPKTSCSWSSKYKTNWVITD